MKLTTLCYLEKDGQILMLHRTKKSNDANEGKWIGVGGKLNDGESPLECVCREVKEETNLTITNPQLRGILTFILPRWENELTFLYTCNEFSGQLGECDEGQLAWVDRSRVLKLNLWEGDRPFLKKLMDNVPFFAMKLIYDERDNLIEAIEEGSESAG